jgi:hypothetical protein
LVPHSIVINNKVQPSLLQSSNFQLVATFRLGVFQLWTML